VNVAIGNTAVSKASGRLIWFLVLLFVTAAIDRVNVGFAALTMNKDIGLSAAAFGFGAGVFSIGYLIFELPSNLILERVGARRWISRIMITWGIASAAMMLVHNPTTFYALRFLLGAAEAGFFPGAILYLGYWFPAQHRARLSALFLLAIPLSQVLSAALSGVVLQSLNGVFGLAGWRWLFLVEGLPAVALGVITYFYLSDRPRDAQWLNQAEQTYLETTLAEEERTLNKVNDKRWARAFSNPATLVLGLVYFGIDLALTGVPLWLPQIVRTLGFSYFVTGIVAAVPPLVGAAAMVVWSRNSDRTGERLWHLIGAIGVTALGWLLAVPFIHSPLLLIASLAIASAGIFAATSIFWSLPTSVLAGTSAASGIAVIGVIGNLGAAFGPIMMGAIKDATNGFAATFVFMAICALFAGVVMFIGGVKFAPRVPSAGTALRMDRLYGPDAATDAT
jgi:MFS transporter, ACS family, tartrate transporter